MLFEPTVHAFKQFNDDDCMTLAASIAFYTLFALPPLLFLLAVVISFGMSTLYAADEANARTMEFLKNQASQLIGDSAAAAEVESMLRAVTMRSGVGWKSALSLLGVLIGATGLMAALQSSLNHVWKVKPNPDSGFARHFLIKRFFSLAMILGFGFVLLVSFILSTLLTVLGSYAVSKLGLSGMVPPLINHGLIFITGWIFFLGVFKFMPDVHVPFRSALWGGLFTVVLFTLGRVILFLYFQFASPGEQLGTAAGAVAIILLWVYYSTVIMLFGAEFTANLAKATGEPIVPEPGAVTVTENIMEPDRSTESLADKR